MTLKKKNSAAARLLAAVLLFVSLWSCSSEKAGDWEYVASNLPADARVVATVTSGLFDAMKEGDNAIDADVVNAFPPEYLLYVDCTSGAFFTWPVRDPEKATAAISSWEQVEIGHTGEDARAVATRNAVVVCDGRQTWLFPGTTDIAKTMSAVGQMCDDARRGDKELSERGLCSNPTAMSVITTPPGGGTFKIYANVDSHPLTVDLSVTHSQSGHLGFGYKAVVKRHDKNGTLVPLSSSVLQSDAEWLKNQLNGHHTHFSALASASLARGALPDMLSSVVSPYLTITQRMAMGTLVPLLRNAEGPVFASAKYADGQGHYRLVVCFADAQSASQAASRLTNLAADRVPGLGIAANGNEVIFSYIGEWPELLASPERDGITDFRLIVQPKHAVLSFESETSPAEGVGMLLGLLTR